MDEKLQFILKFPYLIECKPTYYQGITNIKGNLIKISLHCPHFPAMTDVQIQILGLLEELQYNPEDFSNVGDFMAAIETSLAASFPDNPSSTLNVKNCQSVLQQLCAIEDRSRVELSRDMKTITLRKFSGFPDHFLTIAVQDSGQFKIVDHSLPDQVKFHLVGSSIAEFMTTFHTQLGYLEEFYANLSDLDEICYIIAPVPATTKSNYRIFKFDEKIFIRVVLDPLVASKVDLKFIGPIHEVERLRQVYMERIHDWDDELNVHKNLLRMFDLTFFPYRPDCDPNLAEHKSCSICFEFNLDGAYPIVTCFNAHCEVIFHVACLQKWFSTLNETKQLNCTVTSGLCPYCKQKLTTFLDICDEGLAT